MRSRILLLELLSLSWLQVAAQPLQVNERATKAILLDGKSAISLSLSNSSGGSLSAALRLEWVGLTRMAGPVVERHLDAAPGMSTEVIPLSLPVERNDGQIWLRLQYHLKWDGGESQGILAITEIAPYAFELHASAPRVVHPGERYRVSASARQPVLHGPVEGVTITGILRTVGHILHASGVTAADGHAVLDFQLPEEMAAPDSTLSLHGLLGDYGQETAVQIQNETKGTVYISTDKPIYQPGQTLHIRLLNFTPARRAVAGTPLEVTIDDPDDTTVFSARLRTNRFGVASVDWNIPNNLRLGDYEIKVDDNDSDSENSPRKIKISRYELPEFAVKVKPDRRFYLPGQNALVEIHADYLFGKPVPNGKVRVVRFERRQWDFHLQKWDIDEVELDKGRTDTLGRFTARLNLSEAHERLKGQDERWSRFSDSRFIAYVTDSGTGRTEERRFDLRATRQPIHIYLQRRGSQSTEAYLQTLYADGEPARCRITMSNREPFSTNPYGVARLRLTDKDEDDGAKITAIDSAGLKGHYEQDVTVVDSDDLMEVETSKTLYRQGESIRVTVRASQPELALEIIHGRKLIETRWLNLKDGSVSMEIPWRTEFTGQVTFGIVVPGEPGRTGFRTVLFQGGNQDLNVSASSGQPEYRPGEEARMTFQARLPDGNPVESAMGVSVVDVAVGERARTDIGEEELGEDEDTGLQHLVSSQPFSTDLDLLAEFKLVSSGYYPNFDERVGFQQGLGSQFSRLLTAEMQAAVRVLDDRYKKDYHHPQDIETLRRDLEEGGVAWASLRDPWGTPFRPEFSTQSGDYVLRFVSAGPDKQFDTGDDLEARSLTWKSFKPYGDAIQKALRSLPAFPRTRDATRTALAAAGIALDAIPDIWGTALKVKFTIERDQSVLQFQSAGRDRIFGTLDDRWIDRISGPYFQETRRRLEIALNESEIFPATIGQWNRLLQSAGLFPLKDPWGGTLYVVFAEQAMRSDLRKQYSEAKFGEKQETRTQLIPVTLYYHAIHLRSRGPDGQRGTPDDFDLASFSRSKQIEESKESHATAVRPHPGPNTGAIIGAVKDASGAAIRNATIRVIHTGDQWDSGVEFQTATNKQGLYLLDGLLPGTYDLRAESPGFRFLQITQVKVAQGRKTVVDVLLQVGAVAETVTVEAASTVLQTEATQASSGMLLPRNSRSTPRLREYFPETLLWAPSLETGPDGRAELQFRLADNITTWTVKVTGSTVNGEVGTATADIRAFQPFFVDHSPPRVLTQGDEIQLPVTVRNFLEKSQEVVVDLKPESWFTLTGGERRQVHVAAGNSANAVFPMRAVAAVAEGKQRVTARGNSVADAIEKPVAVHPDGRQINATSNAVMKESATLEIQVPDNMVAGSAWGRVKVYPNLIAHVIDGMDGILKRPYGCGEQTISSTYANLLFLRFLKNAGRSNHPLEARAREYLQAGLDRLMGFRAQDGGFNYWGRGAGDVSLTAYALTFLNDATEFGTMDSDVIKDARAWLVKQQTKDGDWPEYDWKKNRDELHTIMQTAGVALALSGDGKSPEAVKLALAFLASRIGTLDEPYGLAVIATLAHRTGEAALEDETLERLRKLALRESGVTYWNLETNTPFYGWGLAGRLETSALVLRALIEAGQARDKELIEGGMLFLIRHKDHHGVWWSTHATINVLEAIIEASRSNVVEDPGGPVEILVNDRVVGTVVLPSSKELTGPVFRDVSSFVGPGVNRVTLRRGRAGGQAQVQFAANYYVPWDKPANTSALQPLRLQVSYDKTALRAGESVTCRVQAERVGFRGYGMLLAEIGLPPGVEVDRQSLEKAVESAGYVVNHFDVLPDRVVFYLWSQAGGSTFEFRFRPRMSMRAKTESSLLYDYYNPDARVVAPPVMFSVSPR